MTLQTSPNAIRRWLGIAALHNSDSLKPIEDIDGERAKSLRVYWAEDERKQILRSLRGPDDAA